MSAVESKQTAVQIGAVLQYLDFKSEHNHLTETFHKLHPAQACGC